MVLTTIFNNLRQFQKASEEFSKSQRRIFKKSAKNFQKVSEEFLKSQRTIF
jgi:hypothetical protein